MFEEITASSLVKIDIHGHRVDDTPSPVNAAGFTIHSAIPKARADAAAVLHLPTPAGQAVSAMRCGLLPHTPTAIIVTHDIDYHDYAGIATNLDHAKRKLADIGNSTVVRSST